MTALSHSPAEILLKEFEDSGITVGDTGTASWEGRVNRVPDEPDEVIVVNDTQGVEDGRQMHGATDVFAGVQIRIRASTYRPAYAKANEVQEHLDSITKAAVSLSNETGTGSTNYEIHAVHRTGDAIPLGTDDDQREHFVINATLRVKET